MWRWAFILLGVLWSFQDLWCLTLIWGQFPVIIVVNISSFSLFLLLVFPLHVYYTFSSSLTVLRYSVLLWEEGLVLFVGFLFGFFFLVSFSLRFSVSERFPLKYPQAQSCFPQPSPVNQQAHQRHSSFSQCSWLPTFLFGSFFFFISLFYCPSVFPMLSTLSIIILSILSILI